jgi:probable HAF family extracellular repeat protein
MNTRTVISASSIVCLLLSAAAGAQTQVPQLSLTPIPTPAGATGATNVEPGSVDAKGNVFGSAQLTSGFNLIEWVGGTTPVVYPRLPADQNNTAVDYGFAAFNAAGAVVGAAGRNGTPTSAPTAQGIYWDTSKHPTAVPGSGGLVGISDANLLVGTVGPSDGGTAAYWTSPTSQPTLLPYPSQIDCADPVRNFCYSWTTAVSPNGRYITGAANLEDIHTSYGLMWVNGVQVSNYGGYDVNANQVTNAGVVIGLFKTDFPSPNPPEFWVRHAFEWEAGTLTDLGCLPGAPAGSTFESGAVAMNSAGIIVGYSQVDTYIYHATMWVNRQIVDLNTTLGSQLPSGWHLRTATSINDAGEILLAAQNDDTGESRYYLAKPLITTHTTVTSNINPSTYGQSIHLVAKVSPDSGPVPTTGSVSWYDNGALLGTARLTTIGTASWEPSTWTGGVHNVTAVFPASSTLGGSTSPVFKQTVNAASTRTTVSASVNPATHGQSVQLTATVVPTSGTIAGTVTFKSGTTVLGTGTLDGRTKQTHFTTRFATAGSYAITAVYAGSQNFLTSTSSTLTLTVK